MAWASKITTSLYGNRLGLQNMSSGATGSKPADFVVGAEGVRQSVTTQDSSASVMDPWGISVMTTSVNVTTSSIYKLGTPIPGVSKTLVFGSTNTATNAIFAYTSTDGSITFAGTTLGSTMCCLGSTSGFRSAITLVALNSTGWVVTSHMSTAVLNASTVSS